MTTYLARRKLFCLSVQYAKETTKKERKHRGASKMELVGSVKNYDWGKLGSESIVAQLAALNDSNFVVDDTKPYSELWMGDHPSGPSIVKTTGKELSAELQQRLPFLFKVLSIRKALSIQVHPNKEEAERLHKERPEIYKDPNHKPELAIALTPFQALCGFRPYDQIYGFCEELPPLKQLVGGDDIVKALKGDTVDNLRACYEKLMTSPADSITACINDIAANYTTVLERHQLLDVFNTINKDFPSDVGILSIFFMNLLCLHPGQAVYLGANEIHAYLHGDCIECMACSDNVIRAGLTPKYKDVNQLISCLNYAGFPAEKKLFPPYRIDAHVQLFVPPVNDFAVAQIALPKSVRDYKLQVQATGSILLTLHGKRKLHVNPKAGGTEIQLSRGSIVYIPPEAAPEIELLPVEEAGGDDFVAYMAMYNSFRS